MGVVPKYIKDRKEELASIIKQSEVIDINCPDGHIPLPEEDRLRALEIAKKRKCSIIFVFQSYNINYLFIQDLIH